MNTYTITGPACILDSGPYPPGWCMADTPCPIGMCAADTLRAMTEQTDNTPTITDTPKTDGFHLIITPGLQQNKGLVRFDLIDSDGDEVAHAVIGAPVLVAVAEDPTVQHLHLDMHTGPAYQGIDVRVEHVGTITDIPGFMEKLQSKLRASLVDAYGEEAISKAEEAAGVAPGWQARSDAAEPTS